MWIRHLLKWLASAGAAVGLTAVSTHPGQMESNVAAWLGYFGVASWSEGFTATTDLWIAVGIAPLAIGAFVLWTYPLFRRDDAKAVKRNPGNGWRVARLITKAWTVRRAEALYRDFRSQAHRSEELAVLAARNLRRWRASGRNEADAWDLWSTGDEEGAYSLEELGEAVSALEKEFPESWWAKRHHTRKRAVDWLKLKPASLKMSACAGNPTASFNLSVTPSLRAWRELERWLRSKLAGKAREAG